MFNKILRPVARSVITRGTQRRLGHHGSDVKMATLDDVPHPEGSWQENYDKKQKKYSVHLIAGVGSLVATIVTVLQFELIYFNYGPPKPKDA